MRCFRALRLVLSLGASLAVLPAAAAHADAVCSFSATTHTLTVTLGTGGGVVGHLADGDTIGVGSMPGALTACAGANDNTVDTINVLSGLGGGRDILYVDLAQGDFAPGHTIEAGGRSEIEWNVDLGDGFDEVAFSGAHVIRGGTAGLNLDPPDGSGDADVDVVLAHEELLFVVGGPGADVFDLTGGGALGGSFPVAQGLYGMAGDDVLRLGDGGGTAFGYQGADLVVGGAGTDAVGGCSGDDVVDGGPGRDTVNFNCADPALAEGGVVSGVTYDLGGPARQTLGGPDGTDTITGVQGVVGGSGDDDLTGGPGDDIVYGRDGNDVLRASGGSDEIDGGGDEDTMTYAATMGPVSSTSAGAISHPGGVDTVDVEDVVGSAYDDRLVGDAGPNRLVGGPGADSLDGAGGNDRLESGDGGSIDALVCGAGNDTALADDVDGVAADCETVTRLDTIAPDTVITDGPPEGATVAAQTITVSFGSPDAGAGGSFECRLDDGPWAACTSPDTRTGVSDGAHRFAVRAVDAGRNVDPTPATRSFTVAMPSLRPVQPTSTGTVTNSVTFTPARCRVPQLKGHTLASARRRLKAAHCALGQVRRPRRPRGVLVVARQGRPPGTVAVAGTKVVVRLRVRAPRGRA